MSTNDNTLAWLKSLKPGDKVVMIDKHGRYLTEFWHQENGYSGIGSLGFDIDNFDNSFKHWTNEGYTFEAPNEDDLLREEYKQRIAKQLPYWWKVLSTNKLKQLAAIFDEPA